MKNNFKDIFKKISKRTFIVFGAVLLASISAIATFIISVAAADYTVPIKSITLTSAHTSFTSNEPGSWNIEKSAQWTGHGKARITFDVSSIMKSPEGHKDVIFVLDNSGSMSGDKLAQVKHDATELIESLLSDDQNRAALVNFNSTAEVLSMLTNDKDSLLQKIDALTDAGCTNYYQGFLKAEDVLDGYVKSQDREVVLLFLTDGYPNEETPNEVSEYQRIKSLYPYLTIAGIQYEMGEEILDAISDVSDLQYIATIDSLNNVLFDAALVPYTYSEFVLTDYIDDEFWNVESVDGIIASIGETTLSYNGSTPVVTWNISDLYRSGSSAQLTIEITLKDEYKDSEGLYPTNKKETVETKLEDTPDEDIESENTPVLKNVYEVIYEGNAPSDCTVSGTPESEKHAVFSNVEISDAVPTCSGYNFSGWEIATEGVKKLNDDYFKMPESDVTLRATWTKVSISKTMDGTVYVAHTLYNAVANKTLGVDSELGVKFNSSSYASGVYTLAAHAEDENPVYYYHGNVSDNYVLFAGYCWKVVRTTSTGGVKLIYDGSPDANGACTATGASAQSSTSAFNSSYDSPAYNGYMYGDAYMYSTAAITINQSFTTTETMFSSSSLGTNYWYADSAIYGTPTANSWNLVDSYKVSATTDYPNLVGKYTFRNATETYTNTNVQYIAAVNNSTYYYIQLSGNTSLSAQNYTYTFGDIFTDNGDGTYTIDNPATINRSDWYANYANMKNKYVCKNATNDTCSDLWYITATSATNFTYVKASTPITIAKSRNGLELQDTATVTYGDIVTNPSNYSEYKYTCNTTGTTCIESNLRLVTAYSATGYAYAPNHYYGSSVTWNGSSYALVDPIDLENYNSLDALSTHHYMCTSNGLKACAQVAYIYYYTGSGTAYYITLKNGVDSVDEALEQMQTNTTDSKIKTTIDTWYANNLVDYTEKLEDTVYCNDRSMNTNTNGWIADGGKTNEYLYYGAYGRNAQTYAPSVDCANKNDAFTVEDTVNGNGALTYPVGLITADEMTLAGASWSGYYSNNYLKTDRFVWSGSPYSFNLFYAYEFSEISSGALSNYSVDYSRGVRPLVSIAPETFIQSGEGSQTDPWVLE